MRVGEYLKGMGYKDIARPYVSAARECERYSYPAEMAELLCQVDDWMDKNTETVWQFYVDILQKNKSALL